MVHYWKQFVPIIYLPLHDLHYLARSLIFTTWTSGHLCSSSSHSTIACSTCSKSCSSDVPSSQTLPLYAMVITMKIPLVWLSPPPLLLSFPIASNLVWRSLKLIIVAASYCWQVIIAATKDRLLTASMTSWSIPFIHTKQNSGGTDYMNHPT